MKNEVNWIKCKTCHQIYIRETKCYLKNRVNEDESYVKNKNITHYADIMHQQSGSYSNGYIASINSKSNWNTGQETGCDSGTGSGGYRRESIRKSANNKVVTTCDLLCFAFQCAREMQYLAHRKVGHNFCPNIYILF